MSSRLIPHWMSPWIQVDWSCINLTAILLLIAAIATFTASPAGLIITSMGKAAHFQAHSAKFTRSLSIIDLGREVFPVFSKTQFLNTYNLLRQMMIDTQLAKGVYE